MSDNKHTYVRSFAVSRPIREKYKTETGFNTRTVGTRYGDAWVTVDIAKIGLRLGNKALGNKGRKCRALDGAVTVIIRNERDERVMA